MQYFISQYLKFELMNKNFKLLCIVILAMTISGCGKFFEEKSQNFAYVSTVSDLQELLIGGAYDSYYQEKNPAIFSSHDAYDIRSAINSNSAIHLMDDDITEYGYGPLVVSGSSVVSWARSYARSIHMWQQELFLDNNGVQYDDKTWRKFYKFIAVANSVIYLLDELRAGEKNVDLTNRTEGEARYLRASHYFHLVNLYAEPYDKNEADKQLGVPLKITEFIEAGQFTRNTVKEIYTQIVFDLEKAVKCLEGLKPINGNRVSYSAAATLLSRVYLYMEEYEKAIKYADLAINDKNHALLNLNERKATDNFLFLTSPETLLTQGNYNLQVIMTDEHNPSKPWDPQANAYRVSQELLDMYGDDDLRKDAFFISTSKGGGVVKRCLKMRNLLEGGVSDNQLVRVSEAYLNKAEAEAALNLVGAKNTIEKLLVNRYAKDKVPAINVQGDDLLEYIRDERRRELCFEGHRWYDIRRYAVNKRKPLSKAIKHISLVYLGSESSGRYDVEGVYVLKPYAEDKAAYMFPIPTYAMIFNDGVLVQNPARPDRSISVE